jgi:hypothetical protein
MSAENSADRPSLAQEIQDITEAITALDSAVWRAKRAADALGLSIKALDDLERDVERWDGEVDARVEAINASLSGAK